jgi:hypothetical protein
MERGESDEKSRYFQQVAQKIRSSWLQLQSCAELYGFAWMMIQMLLILSLHL